MKFMLAVLVLLFPFVLPAGESSHPGGALDQWLHGAGTIEPKPIVRGTRVVSGVATTPTVGFAYSMVYNIEGDWHPSTHKIASHIASAHGINPAGMSRSQMLMAHDRAHGVNVRASVPTPPRVRYRTSSACPNGRCPIN